MIFVYIPLLLVVIVVGYYGYGAYRVVVLQRKKSRAYWEAKRREPIAEGAIRIVALGDSVMQSIGASKPELGVAGRIATFVAEQTRREVHIDNVSVFGAKLANVVEEQLAKIDLVGADIIVVVAGANDALRKTDVDEFKESAKRLMQGLSPEKTIVCDVAYVKNREAYQSVLHEARSNRAITRADLERAFTEREITERMNAGDFVHPNDYAYTFWFAAFEPALKQMIIDRKLA